jgi:poly(hydroxyalkanoate) depolymerase family esterase
MKLRNPFIGAMMKATRAATRKTAAAMQKQAMIAAIAVIRQALKPTLPGDTSTAAARRRPAKTVIPGKPVSRSHTAHADVGVGLQKNDAAATVDIGMPGQFIMRSLSNAAGKRDYKVYIPKTYSGRPMPLLVMLHGCTQDPDDFATGTRMNKIAEKAGCFVAYPAQSTSANGHKCWNWFNEIDQQRDRGEASIIADITRAVINAYGCDPERIFVAGLSAGGAMAVIMGNRYPELYSAVGVHSGLPYAAARNLSSALAAMRRGAVDVKPEESDDVKALPVIVFHGDIDKTVHPRNGEQIIEQALAHVASTERKEQGPVGKSRDGMPVYTKVVYEDRKHRPMAELWTLHGAAHAWSGGSSDGSYTTANGPDASAEMMRFFTTAGAQ